MTILKNTLHEDDQTGTIKKMLSLSNAHLFNSLVKLASQATGRTESEIIEECVEERFLNCRQEMIKTRSNCDSSMDTFRLPGHAATFSATMPRCLKGQMTHCSN